MDNKSKDFFDMLMQKLKEMPIEILQEAYETCTLDRPANYLIKGSPIILDLSNATSYDVISDDVLMVQCQKSKNVIVYPNTSTQIEQLNEIILAAS